MIRTVRFIYYKCLAICVWQRSLHEHDLAPMYKVTIRYIVNAQSFRILIKNYSTASLVSVRRFENIELE